TDFNGSSAVENRNSREFKLSGQIDILVSENDEIWKAIALFSQNIQGCRMQIGKQVIIFINRCINPFFGCCLFKPFCKIKKLLSGQVPIIDDPSGTGRHYVLSPFGWLLSFGLFIFSMIYYNSTIHNYR